MAYRFCLLMGQSTLLKECITIVSHLATLAKKCVRGIADLNPSKANIISGPSVAYVFYKWR